MFAYSYNGDELLASLEAAIKEIDRKLVGMVQKFTMRMSLSAINSTPMGDSDKNVDWYQKRVTENLYGSLKLQPTEGFAQGSWQATPDSNGVINTDIQQLYGKESGDLALNKIQQSMGKYKLGQTVFITNTGPYIKALEQNYSDKTHGQGIMKPTMMMVETAIQADLDDYYHKS